MRIVHPGRKRAAGPAWGRLPVVLTAAMILTATAWAAAQVGGRGGPKALGWLPAAFALATAAAAAIGAARVPGVPPGAARFWRHLGAAVALAAASLALPTTALLRAGPAGDPPAGWLPVATELMSSTAVALVVWALLRVPVGRLTPGQWVRLLLDTVTVVVGVGLVIWYASFGAAFLARPVDDSPWTQLVVGSLLLGGLAAVAKAVLMGPGPVDPGALRTLGMSLLVGGCSAAAASVVPDTAAVAPGQLFTPVIAMLTVLAARRQAVAALRGSTGRGARRAERSYRLLPYVALAATDVLLLLATRAGADLRRTVVVAGAIAVTSLVAVRQFAASADNARLVRQLRGQEERLRHQADHDALTQLANRGLFADRLDAALAGEDGQRIAVLLVDLDDFKSVNDTLGHAVGDQLLLGVAGRLRQCVRPEDTVARLGGDEFGVLLRGVAPADAEAAAGRVLASLATPVDADEHRLLVRASIGVAVAGPGDRSGTLLRNADIAMYAAKERGKSVYLRYVPGMATNVLEHARLGAQLREAIHGGQLYPVFQPVTDLISGRIIGMETLVRWTHPVRGQVQPVEFIPTAERTGLIVPMGRWLLAEACGRLARWKREYGEHGPATIGVNVSGRQLAEPRFAADTAAAVLAAGLEPHNLVLEVTEDSVLTGGEVIETLRQVHAFGVKIALDDFGTGQSSLGLLRSCPVDILKLDKSFVDGIAEGTGQAAIATAVVRMAQALGLDAVAEGIEEQKQVEFLTGIGYHLGQGYHLARPMPADQIVALFVPAGPAAVSVPSPAVPATGS
ncbi:MAG TPA: EAL domain-containing protein [Pilimelia sp.]|nr:EAL domain-containing protein [Pilimelia sp.]